MSRTSPLTVFLLCIALLVVRVGSAHLHLCFDGQEPASSLHIADSGELNEHADDGSPHRDANIELGNDGPGKLPKLDLQLLALVFAAVFALCFIEPARFARSFGPSASPAVPIRLRPPLRGPPSFSVA